MKITRKQYEELDFLFGDDINEFNKKMEELFDVEVRPIVVYQYFDCGDYIGDSHTYTARDLLHELEVEITK